MTSTLLFIIYNGKEFYQSKRYEINPIIDRVGGGDSFSGGLIHGMQRMPSESLYVINIDMNGNKVLECIIVNGRIQQKHNKTKKYLDGDFGGVPIPGYLDFEEMTRYHEV